MRLVCILSFQAPGVQGRSRAEDPQIRRDVSAKKKAELCAKYSGGTNQGNSVQKKQQERTTCPKSPAIIKRGRAYCVAM